jgi:hypothetical protein
MAVHKPGQSTERIGFSFSTLCCFTARMAARNAKYAFSVVETFVGMRMVGALMR